MNTFVIGILVGVALFSLVWLVITLQKVYTMLLEFRAAVDTLNKSIQLLIYKTNKIEKMSESTMQAAETFVDALRASAEQMMRHPGMPMPPGNMHPDSFDDLRKSFEDGIRNMEDGFEDTDEDSDEEEGPNEPWKKN